MKPILTNYERLEILKLATQNAETTDSVERYYKKLVDLYLDYRPDEG